MRYDTDEASYRAYNSTEPFRTNLLSIESNDNPEESILKFIRDNRCRFLNAVNALPPERREVAIEYFLLRKTERQISIIHGRKSQATLAKEIAAILRVVGCAMRGMPIPIQPKSRGRHPVIRHRDSKIIGDFKVDMANPRARDLFAPLGGNSSNTQCF